MGCGGSKDVKPSALDGSEPAGGADPMHTVEDIIAAAKRSGWDTLNLAQNKANPDEELEEGWLVERGLDLEEGLPASAFSCSSVTTFTMKAAQLPELPPGIGLMVQLVTLDLAENALTVLPEEIGALAALESLDVSENELTTLPATIGGLVALKSLSAFKNALKSLPAELGNCAALEEINLFNNKLIKVPPTLSQLGELRDVNLGGNKIKTLPKLDNWTKVEELRVHQNTLISQVLPSFAPMVALRFLKMDMNRAASALPELGSHPALEHIECNNCSLEELPAKEVFDALPALRVLNAQSNQIGAVPALANSELDTLNLSSNPKVTAMPDMSGCPKLRIFFMQSCAIETLDAGNASLSGLERCMVMGNKIPADDATVAALRATCDGNGGWLKDGTEKN